MKFTVKQLKRIIKESIYAEEKKSKRVWELEPGDAFSTDEGRTWVRVHFIKSDPDPSTADMYTITTTTQDQFKLDADELVLLPVEPGELTKVNQLP